MGNRNNIQSLQGAGWKYFNCPFSAHMSVKKKEKTKKNQIYLWGSNGGFNLQLTTTMHKWGQMQKREKSFYWHTTQIACLPFLLHPLNSGCLWLPTTRVRPDFRSTPSQSFSSKCPFLPEYFLIENTWNNNLADQCTQLYIVCLSVWLPVCLWFLAGGFWWQVLNQSCKIFFPVCLYICATYSVLLTLDKTWWGTSTLFKVKSNNQCWPVIAFFFQYPSIPYW